ncbi:hypothetical protein BGZ67_009911 [Mortierella alpina]|nr:hypothetical protein BGZ67_009911 [Mortierella alpina]
MSMSSDIHSQGFVTVRIDRPFDSEEEVKASIKNDNSTTEIARQKGAQSEGELGQVRDRGDDVQSAGLVKRVQSSPHLASSVLSENRSSQAQSSQQGDQSEFTGEQDSFHTSNLSSISSPLTPRGHATQGSKNKSVCRWYFRSAASIQSIGEDNNDIGDRSCSSDRDKDDEEESEKQSERESERESEWESEWEDELDNEKQSEESDKEHKPLVSLPLECIHRDGNDQQQPAAVKASTRFAKWTFDMTECEDGLFNVVFSMFTANLAILRLDTIAFCIESEPGNPEPVESHLS